MIPEVFHSLSTDKWPFRRLSQLESLPLSRPEKCVGQQLGVDMDNIDITMADDELTIEGRHQTETKENSDSYQRIERVTGNFQRHFSLPDTANGEAIKAATGDGVVTVTNPKQEKVKPRKIDVVTA